LRIALALTAALLVVEVIGGFLSNSIAILADAGHMLTDVAALALALFVAWFSSSRRRRRRPTATCGGRSWPPSQWRDAAADFRVDSVGSRIAVPAPAAIEGGLMLAVATGGLIVNLIAARVLVGTSTDSMNARGAYLHVLGDCSRASAPWSRRFFIRYTGWLAADRRVDLYYRPHYAGARRLVRESVDILLEST
jgi:cobalt-zinc-cadmium efflux system protein